MLLWPVTETANCLPVSISSFIIRSRIPFLPGFSMAYHCSAIDYILLPILQSSVTVWLISGQWYLTGNVTVIFGITSFNGSYLPYCSLANYFISQQIHPPSRHNCSCSQKYFLSAAQQRSQKQLKKKKACFRNTSSVWIILRRLSWVLYLWIPVILIASSCQWGQCNS